MQQRWIIGSTVAVTGLLACTGLYFMQRSDALETGDDFASWTPSPAAIRRAVGAAKAGEDAQTLLTRQALFAKMFQERFRSHEPPMAVGVRFVGNNRLKLMCPARLEPWNIDRIALSAWREAQTAFGTGFDIDLYATYIGTPPIEIGTLRTRADSPQVARIFYHDPHFLHHP